MAATARRLTRVHATQSGVARMMEGCSVAMRDGTVLGSVLHMMIDARTQQLRYVVLACNAGGELAIPWKSLYFDSAASRLVCWAW